MGLAWVESHKEHDSEEFSYERPVLVIRRWNRCLWILIVTLAWVGLMLGFMIPGKFFLLRSYKMYCLETGAHGTRTTEDKP